MIFIDTSFWIVYSNKRDTKYASAVELLQRSGGTELVTTNHVRGETWTFLRRRTGHDVATRFLDGLDRSSQVRVVFVSEQQEDDAVRWLRRHDERAYSYVDATSFVVMRALHVRNVLSFDADFGVAGFRLLT